MGSRHVKKKTYRQNWPAYNKAQTLEEELFLSILCTIVDRLDLPDMWLGIGRKPIPLRDMIVCCTLKKYYNKSYRRIMSTIRRAHREGYISVLPSFNSVRNYMANPFVKPYVQLAIEESPKPLVKLENKFTVDGTGFGTHKKKRWSDIRKEDRKSKKKSSKKEYIKLIAVSGVKTNMITSADVTEGKRHESPFFSPLVRRTARNFTMEEISADKAYPSRHNCNVAEEVGAMPYIMPRSNATTRAGGSRAWRRMIRLFKENKEEFKKHYHLRSNGESTFGAMKKKLGEYVSSLKKEAQMNEILFEVLAYNITVLIHCMFEYGITV